MSNKKGIRKKQKLHDQYRVELFLWARAMPPWYRFIARYKWKKSRPRMKRR